MIYVFSKAGAYYNRIDIKGDFKGWISKKSHLPPNTSTITSTQYGGAKRNDSEGGDGKRCALSVIQNPTSSVKGGHPTEKPMELYKFVIERYCPVGGTVLDPTAGSCNSVFSAYELDRNGIAIEKDKGFYDKACKRMDAL
jgi:site-specific DNA-methyltransferase (adenine-specific)